jgi:hypothetical protein
MRQNRSRRNGRPIKLLNRSGPRIQNFNTSDQRIAALNRCKDRRGETRRKGPSVIGRAGLDIAPLPRDDIEILPCALVAFVMRWMLGQAEVCAACGLLVVTMFQPAQPPLM